MLTVFADHANPPAADDDLALITHAFDRCPDFHIPLCLTTETTGTTEKIIKHLSFSVVSVVSVVHKIHYLKRYVIRPRVKS